MSDPYFGEIRMFPFNFAPIGWALCAGQLLPVSQNTQLFSVIGTSFGGNGTSNFALPDLQDLVPIGLGDGPGLSPRTVGEVGGEMAVTLVSAQMPSHTHNMVATTTQGTTATASGNQLALADTGSKQGGGNEADFYSSNTGQAKTGLPASAISTAGNGMPHNNMMPFLGLNFCISLQGTYPSRN
jgi:microcystin-dependent protein